MAPYWDEAIFLLETLVMKAWGQDENGMDLSFANGPVTIRGSNDPSKFKKKMEDPYAKPVTGKRIKTDMRKSLRDILYTYIQIVKQRRNNPKTKVKKLTIIVLTDGKWGAKTSEHDVEDDIVDFVKALKKEQGNYGQVRQVSIEFVQLGYDEGAAFRMQRLDDELPFLGVE